MKGSITVLPRVSAALSHFIKPITALQNNKSPVKHGTDDGGTPNSPLEFKRFKKEDAKQEDQKQGEHSSQEAESQKKNEGKVIPLFQNQSDAPNSGFPTPDTKGNLGQVILQLRSLLQQGKGSLEKFLPGRTYQNSSKSQRNSGKIRKGAMLDHKI